MTKRERAVVKMTDRQRVLREFPTARRMVDRNGSAVIGCGLSTVLGKNWHDAADNLPPREKKKGASRG